MKQALINLFSSYSSIYVAVFVLVIFIILYNRIRKVEKIVFVVILVYALTEFVAGIMIYFHQHNHWVYNLGLIPQAATIGIALIGNLKNPSRKKLLSVVLIAMLILHLVNLAFFQGLSQFANYTFIPVCSWLAVISFVYLKEQMGYIHINPLDSLLSWLAIATLIDQVASMPLVSVLGWTTFLETQYIIKLWSVVTWIYAFWYLTILFGLLWTTTSLRSVFSSR